MDLKIYPKKKKCLLCFSVSRLTAQHHAELLTSAVQPDSYSFVIPCLYDRVPSRAIHSAAAEVEE